MSAAMPGVPAQCVDLAAIDQIAIPLYTPGWLDSPEAIRVLG